MNKYKQTDGLDGQLERLAQSDMYPFHMPGHKRNPRFLNLPAAVQIDITEIDGFDNLHHAGGIIKEAQDQAAAMVHARRTWFLVNGSTCGLLAAVSACTRRGGRILVARNCHKAVYNAIELNGLNPVYIYPKIHETYGIFGGIDAGQVRRLLEKYPDVMAVVITSPTYEGVISHVNAIAGIVHSYGIPLIVDEAHGAHLGYSPRFEASAVTCGADLVIQSLHKTLPSMTQTAVLHLCGSLADEGQVQKYLSIFQTSSPSYVMMAGMDQCMRLIREQGEMLFEAYYQRLIRLRRDLAQLKNIHLFSEDDLCRVPQSRYDISKLVLFVNSPDGGLGPWLYHQLREKYHLQLEMASADYVLAMTSICDTDEGFERLAEALRALDKILDKTLDKIRDKGPDAGWKAGAGAVPVIETPGINSYEASLRPTESVPRKQAVGRICGDYLYVYPPGIPFVVPGEVIDQKMIDLMDMYQSLGLEIQGGADGAAVKLCVLKEQ